MLESQGERGLQELLELARADLEDCALQRQSLQDEARMLNLLLQTFEQEQAQLSESYSAPWPSPWRPICVVSPRPLHGLACGLIPAKALLISIGNGIPALLGPSTISAAEPGAPGCCCAPGHGRGLGSCYDGVLPVLFDDAFTNVDPSRWSALNAMLQRARERGFRCCC